MGLLRLIQLCVFAAVVVLSLLSLAETNLLVHFDKAPPARSRFTTAIFRYSVIRSDRFNPCKSKNNGCSIYCEVFLEFSFFLFVFSPKWSSVSGTLHFV